MCLPPVAPGQTVCSDVSGPQERVQRRIMEQIVDCAPVVPLLDAPVPQTVDRLVEVDTVVPELVIEVPKITLHDAIPERAVLPVPPDGRTAGGRARTLLRRLRAG